MVAPADWFPKWLPNWLRIEEVCDGTGRVRYRAWVHYPGAPDVTVSPFVDERAPEDGWVPVPRTYYTWPDLFANGQGLWRTYWWCERRARQWYDKMRQRERNIELHRKRTTWEVCE